MLLKKQNKNFRRNTFLLIACLLTACGNNKIQTCLYGITDNIVKIEAHLCDDQTVDYKKMDGYWLPVEVIISPCEYINLNFYYEDGQIGNIRGFYTEYKSSQKVTFIDKLSTINVNKIHLTHGGRLKGIRSCPSIQDVSFQVDYSKGRACKPQYFDCD